MSSIHRHTDSSAVWHIFIQHPAAYAELRTACKLLCTHKAPSVCFPAVRHNLSLKYTADLLENTQKVARWLGQCFQHLHLLDTDVTNVLLPASDAEKIRSLTIQERMQLVNKEREAAQAAICAALAPGAAHTAANGPEPQALHCGTSMLLNASFPVLPNLQHLTATLRVPWFAEADEEEAAIAEAVSTVPRMLDALSTLAPALSSLCIKSNWADDDDIISVQNPSVWKLHILHGLTSLQLCKGLPLHCSMLRHLPTKLQQLHIDSLEEEEDQSLKVDLAYLTALKDLALSTVSLPGDATLPCQVSKLVVAGLSAITPLTALQQLQILEITHLHESDSDIFFDELVQLQHSHHQLQDISIGYVNDLKTARYESVNWHKVNLKALQLNKSWGDGRAYPVTPATIHDLRKCMMLTSLCIQECCMGVSADSFSAALAALPNLRELQILHVLLPETTNPEEHPLGPVLGRFIYDRDFHETAINGQPAVYAPSICNCSSCCPKDVYDGTPPADRSASDAGLSPLRPGCSSGSRDHRMEAAPSTNWSGVSAPSLSGNSAGAGMSYVDVCSESDTASRDDSCGATYPPVLDDVLWPEDYYNQCSEYPDEDAPYDSYTRAARFHRDSDSEYQAVTTTNILWNSPGHTAAAGAQAGVNSIDKRVSSDACGDKDSFFKRNYADERVLARLEPGQLRALKLTHTGVDFAHDIGHATGLTRQHLVDGAANNYIVRIVAEKLPLLQQLDLSNCKRVTGQALVHISKACEQLTSLRLDDTSVHSHVVDSGVALLNKNKNLKVLSTARTGVSLHSRCIALGGAWLSEGYSRVLQELDGVVAAIG